MQPIVIYDDRWFYCGICKKLSYEFECGHNLCYNDVCDICARARVGMSQYKCPPYLLKELLSKQSHLDDVVAMSEIYKNITEPF